jgi:hypothetical protein
MKESTFSVGIPTNSGEGKLFEVNNLNFLATVAPYNRNNMTFNAV